MSFHGQRSMPDAFAISTFTICSNNYVPTARTFSNSVRRYVQMLLFRLGYRNARQPEEWKASQNGGTDRANERSRRRRLPSF